MLFQLSPRKLGKLVSVVVLLAACEGGVPRSVGASDGGVGEASHPRADSAPSDDAAGPTARARQGADSATSWVDGTVSAHACMGDAADSSGVEYGAAAADGPPPEDCMAPCIWDIVKDCLVAGECIEEAPVTDATGSSSTSCTLESDEWTVEGTRTFFNYGRYREVYRHGKLCYNWSETTGRNSPPPVPVWSGENGVAAIGDGMNVLVNSVFCGSVQQLLQATECMKDPTCDASAPRSYTVDPSQPHCAPWRSLIAAAHGSRCCRSGVCPGEPPK